MLRSQEKWALGRLLPLLLAAVMVVSLFTSALAQRESVSIARFEAADGLAVPAGTALSDLALPDELTAVVVHHSGEEKPDGTTYDADEEETIRVPVSWTDGGLYDPDTPGDYVFTAVLGAGYTYAEARPTLTVTVTADDDTPASTVTPLRAPARAPAGATIQDSYVPGTAAVTGVNVSKITGTAPWDSDNAAGNDASPSNDVVRSFDTIFYNVGYTVNIKDRYLSTYKGFKTARLYVRARLPMPSDQAVFDADAMPWLSDYAVTESGGIQTLTGYYEMAAGDYDYIVPSTGTVRFAVYVKGMANGATVQPTDITLWLDDGSNAAPSSEAVSVNPTATTVSSKANYNVRLDYMTYVYVSSVDFTTGTYVRAQYNKTGGGSDKTGEIRGYRVVIETIDTNAEKGMKGTYVDLDNVSFDLTASYSATWAGQQTGSYSGTSTSGTYRPRLWDYSLIDGSSTGILGRTMTSKYIATNPWSERSLGTAENAVYDSGTMTAAPKSASDYRINVSFTGIKNDYTYPTKAAQADYYGNIRDLETDRQYLAVGMVNLYFPTPADSTTPGTAMTENFTVTVGNISIPDAISTDNVASTPSTRYIWLAGVSHTIYIWKDKQAIDDKMFFSSNTASLARGDSFYLSTHTHSLDTTSTYRAYAFDYAIGFDGTKFRPDVEDPEFLLFRRGYEGTAYTANWLSDTLPAGWTYKVYYLTQWPALDRVANWQFNSQTRFESLAALEASGQTCNALWVELRAPNASSPLQANLIEEARQHIFLKFKVRDNAPYTQRPNDLNNYSTDFKFQNRVYTSLLPASSTLKNYTSFSSVPTAYYSSGWTGAHMEPNRITNGIHYMSGGSWTYDKYGAFRQFNLGTLGQWVRAANGTWTNRGDLDSYSYAVGAFIQVVNEKTTLENAVAQEIDGTARRNYGVSNGERSVDYVLTPRLWDLTSGTAPTSTVTITDTLPKGLRYVPGSAYLGGLYNQPGDRQSSGTVSAGTPLAEGETAAGLPVCDMTSGDVTFTVTENADGTTTLQWVLTNVQCGANMPKLYFSASIGDEDDPLADVADHAQLTTTATIQSTESVRETAETTIVIQKLDSATLVKHVAEEEVRANSPITFTIDYINDSNTTVSELEIRDLLPYDGDDRGSDFAGTYTVSTVTVERLNAAAGTWTMNYSVADSVQGHEEDVFGVNPATTFPARSVSGSTTTFTFPANTRPTLLVFKGANIEAFAKARITITILPNGNQHGDVYWNDTALDADNIPDPVYAVAVAARVNNPSAAVQVRKVISNYADYASDPDLAELTEQQFIVNLTGAAAVETALRHNETSKPITVPITGAEATINVAEIVPYAYSEAYTVSAAITHANGATETQAGKAVTVKPGDTVVITVTNTFVPDSYFKARSEAENVFTKAT